MKKCIFLSIPASMNMDDPLNKSRISAIEAKLISMGYDISTRYEFEAGPDPDLIILDGWADDPICIGDAEFALYMGKKVFTESNLDY